MAAGSKQRVADDRVVIDSIVGDVSGRRAIILDDEIATGGSMLELMDRLKDAGATEAAIVCTHGLFAGKAVERLRDHPFVTEVVTTDTVPPPHGWPELKVRSVRPSSPRRSAASTTGVRVSSLFEGVDPTHAPPQARLPFDPRHEPTSPGGAARPARWCSTSCSSSSSRRVGRASHDESGPVLGALVTAWPFLVGTAVGWLVVRVVRGVWPIDVAPGVTVWFATVLVGMLLRHAIGLRARRRASSWWPRSCSRSSCWAGAPWGRMPSAGPARHARHSHG